MTEKSAMKVAKKAGIEFLIMHEAKRYGVLYRTPEYERIRKIAINLLEKGKSQKHIMKKVRQEMFGYLARVDPTKAVEIEMRYYKRRGHKISGDAQKKILEIAAKEGYAKASAHMGALFKGSKAKKMRKVEKDFQHAVKTGRELRKKFGVDSAEIEINGKKITVADAIKIAKRTKDVRIITGVIDGVMELWRIKGSTRKDARNNFGIAYGEMGSDLDQIARRKEMNCFSGSISAASIAASVLDDIGVKGNVGVVEVIAWGSHEIPHAAAFVDIRKKRYVYDSTRIDEGGKGHLIQTRRTVAKKIVGGRVRSTYFLGSAIPITEAVSAAKTQQKLFEGEDISIDEFNRLPPSYQKYVIEMKKHDQRYIEFAKKVNLKKLNPIVRMRIAATLCEHYYDSGDYDEAYRYAKVVSESVLDAHKRGITNSMSISSFYQQYEKVFNILL